MAFKSKTFGKNDAEGATAAGTKPPTWQGVGPWEEDWGELNVGKRPPSLFVMGVGPTPAWIGSREAAAPAGDPLTNPSFKRPPGRGLQREASSWPPSRHQLRPAGLGPLGYRPSQPPCT